MPQRWTDNGSSQTRWIRLRIWLQDISRNNVLCYIQNIIMLHLYLKSLLWIMIPTLLSYVLVFSFSPPMKLLTLIGFWDLIDVMGFFRGFLLFWLTHRSFLCHQSDPILVRFSTWKRERGTHCTLTLKTELRLNIKIENDENSW